MQRLNLLKKHHLDDQSVARRSVRDLPATIASGSARFVNKFMNKFVAHTDAHRHEIKQPTYRELDIGIAVVHKLNRKYALLLAGEESST